MSLFAFKCDNGRKMGACPQVVRAGMSNIKPLEAPIEAKKQVRILVVDDEPMMIKATTRNFSGKNCVVTGALGGAEALEILKTQKFDIIISDYNMPGMSGGELFNKLTDEQKKTVIFNTGNQNNLETLSPTGRPVLLKPYGQKELFQAVSSIAGPLE